MDVPALSGSIANLDTFIGYFSGFLSAAGWSVSDVPALSTLNTSDQMVTADFMTEGNKGAWTVQNVQTGAFWYVVDTLKPAFSYLAPITFITGTIEPTVVHSYILLAIKQVMSGVKLTGLTSVSTRLQLDTRLNDSQLNFGNSLQSSISPAQFGFGGILAKCKPSTRKVFKSGFGTVEYGSNNYLTLYLRVQRGHITNVVATAAKNFTGDHPSLMPIVPSGLFRIDENLYQSIAGEFGGSLGGINRTIAFANSHQIIAHCFDANKVPQIPYLVAGALKLIDLRESYSEDLPITIATHFACERASTSLYQNLWVNSNAQRYVINGEASHSIGPNFQGQLTIEASDVSPTNTQPWDNGPFEVSEPWYGYAIHTGATKAPIVGQLYDAMVMNEPGQNIDSSNRVDPFTVPEFSADGQNWKRHSVAARATLCLRKTGTYNPTTGLIT